MEFEESIEAIIAFLPFFLISSFFRTEPWAHIAAYRLHISNGTLVSIAYFASETRRYSYIFD